MELWPSFWVWSMCNVSVETDLDHTQPSITCRTMFFSLETNPHIVGSIAPWQSPQRCTQLKHWLLAHLGEAILGNGGILGRRLGKFLNFANTYSDTVARAVFAAVAKPIVPSFPVFDPV